MSITIIAKNVTGGEITIGDLGLPIPALSQNTLVGGASPEKTLSEVLDSLDLGTEISAGNIVINDGTDDLSIADALKHIGVETDYVSEQDEIPSMTSNVDQILTHDSDMVVDDPSGNMLVNG